RCRVATELLARLCHAQQRAPEEGCEQWPAFQLVNDFPLLRQAVLCLRGEVACKPLPNLLRPQNTCDRDESSHALSGGVLLHGLLSQLQVRAAHHVCDPSNGSNVRQYQAQSWKQAIRSN